MSLSSLEPMNSNRSFLERMSHGKNILTPNRNPTYNMHYFVDILVLTIGYIPYGFGVTCWGPNPNSMRKPCKRSSIPLNRCARITGATTAVHLTCEI